MLEIAIPADVQSYKSKLVAGFSVRQLLSIIGAIALAVPIAFIGKNFLSEDAVIWTIIIVTAPIFAVGFFKTLDMPFEEFAKHWLSFNFIPQTRYYENAEIDELDEIEMTIVENMISKEGEEV